MYVYFYMFHYNSVKETRSIGCEKNIYHEKSKELVYLKKKKTSSKQRNAIL